MHLYFAARRSNRWRMLACLAGIVVARTDALTAATETLRVHREGRTLQLEATLPQGVTEVELRITSTRNRPVPKHSDVSPLAPAPTAAGTRARPQNVNVFVRIKLRGSGTA